MEEGFKMFFVYSFLGIAASFLIYVLVRLFRGLKPVECQTGNPLPQQMEINTSGEVSDDKIKLIERIVTEVKEEKIKYALLKEVIEWDSAKKEKPKGFWIWLWSNVKAEDPDYLFKKENDDFNRRMSLGLLPSGITAMGPKGMWKK